MTPVPGSPNGPSGSGRTGAGTGWFIGGAIVALALVAGAVWALTSGDDDDAIVTTDSVEFSMPEATATDDTITEGTAPDFTIPDLTLPSGPGVTVTTPAPTTIAAPTGDGIPPATESPDSLGDDPTMDALAESCYAGGMQACDDLYRDSPLGSAYETYGDTCAGRQPSGSGQYCVDVFGG
jgi:hypothetical protein